MRELPGTVGFLRELHRHGCTDLDRAPRTQLSPLRLQLLECVLRALAHHFCFECRDVAIIPSIAPPSAVEHRRAAPVAKVKQYPEKALAPCEPRHGTHDDHGAGLAFTLSTAARGPPPLLDTVTARDALVLVDCDHGETGPLGMGAASPPAHRVPRSRSPGERSTPGPGTDGGRLSR